MSSRNPRAYQIIEGRAPLGPQRCEFRIGNDRILRLHKYGRDDQFWNFQSLSEVLSKPDYVYRGLKREEREQCLCYVGRPKWRYRSDEARSPFPDGFTLLVFVNPSLEIMKWRIERTVSLEDDRPLNYDTRFGEQL